MQYCKKLKMLVLSFSLAGCVALPKPPDVAICTFDNSSKDDASDRSPNFKCIAANDTRFKIQWNSASADRMIAMPYEDYIKMNAYYKKVFDILEKEFLNKRTKK